MTVRTHAPIQPETFLNGKVQLLLGDPRMVSCSIVLLARAQREKLPSTKGMRAVLIEREPEYQEDVAKRMALVMAGPDEKRHAIIKRKGKVEAAGPLFAGWEPAE